MTGSLLPDIITKSDDADYGSYIFATGFDRPDYYHIYTVTTATLKVPGFTDKENTLLFNNIINNIRKDLELIFEKGKARVIAVGGFHTNHVHELYIGVPLQVSFHRDLRTVVDTVGMHFEQSVALLECCGTGIKTVFNLEECDAYMDVFKQTLNAYRRYEANVH